MTRWRALAGLLALIVAGSAHVSGPRRGSNTYTVRGGDTLEGVATRAGLSVEALARANGIADPHRIRAGRVLTIPSRPVRASGRPVPSPVVVANGNRLHRVRRGETVASIAARYRTTARELAAVNGIGRSGRLRSGTTLQVPSPPWLCPVQARRVDFTNGWGQPRPGGRRHLGIDLFALRGSAVVASVDGIVRPGSGLRSGLAYHLRGFDGNNYFGAHLDSVRASAGPVVRGALIGTVGTTGNARGTTPHLHFEMRPGGGPQVNPYYTLKRWC